MSEPKKQAMFVVKSAVGGSVRMVSTRRSTTEPHLISIKTNGRDNSSVADVALGPKEQLALGLWLIRQACLSRAMEKANSDAPDAEDT